MKRVTVVLATLFLVAPAALAQGTLQVGEPTVEGRQVVVPIVLGGEIGSGVSALDFRLRYNPEALRPISATAGPAASRADKQVMANASTPGEYIVVMMGMNQATCQGGEVARVVLERVETASSSLWDLGIIRQTLTGADGAAMASTALSAGSAQAGTEDPERVVKAGGERASDQALITRTAPTVLPGVDVPESGERALAGEGNQAAQAGTAPNELVAALEARDRARARIPNPKAPEAVQTRTENTSGASRDTRPVGNTEARAQSGVKTVEASNTFGQPARAGENPAAARGASRPALWVAGAAAVITAGLVGLRAWRRRRLR